jgi:hypothetical protein
MGDEMVGDMGGGGGGGNGIGREASSKTGGEVVGVSGRNKAAAEDKEAAGSFTSPSANCLKADPAPFNATIY